jgi:hypothetical protein
MTEGTVEAVARAIRVSLNRDDLPEGGWPEITRQAALAAIAAMPATQPAQVGGDDLVMTIARMWVGPTQIGRIVALDVIAAVNAALTAQEKKRG